MATTLPKIDEGRLERSCRGTIERDRRTAPRIRLGPRAEGIERFEAHFHGQAFSLHRHDTYAIGITLSGVQIFRYRGIQRQCLPSQCHILHPDEMYDGGAGTDEGFGYRIVYVDPSLIQEALRGRPLPFVRDPVVNARILRKRLVPVLSDIDEEIDDLLRTEMVVILAEMLVTAASGATASPGRLRLAALSRIRDRIAADPARVHSMAELERLSGLDRWCLARQFRAAFGTSPGRFRTMRQLDQVRRLLKRGTPLAEAALDAGFCDQSHMSRQFRRAYGLTPARWVSAWSRQASATLA